MRKLIIQVALITGTLFLLIYIVATSNRPGNLKQRYTSKEANMSEVAITKNDSSISENISVEKNTLDLKVDIDELQKLAAVEQKELEELKKQESFNLEWYKSPIALNVINTPTVKIINNFADSMKSIQANDFLVNLSSPEDKANFEAYMKSVLDYKKNLLNRECKQQYDYVLQQIAVDEDSLAISTQVNRNIYAYRLNWKESGKNS